MRVIRETAIFVGNQALEIMVNVKLKLKTKWGTSMLVVSVNTMSMHGRKAASASLAAQCCASPAQFCTS